MLLTTEDQLIGEIAGWLKKHFEAELLSAGRVNRGLLNEKWIIGTNKGRLFAKSYHPGRFKMEDPEFRGKIEHALQLQRMWYQSGGPCPEPLTLEGRCMHILPCGRYMTVMTCCPGAMVPAGRIGEQGMHSLGRAAADMHTVWGAAAASGVGAAVPAGEPAWQLSREEMELAWEVSWEAARSSSGRVRNALQLQKAVADSLRDQDFTPLTAGWAHLDLWADNLLFEGDALTAIVDFDRARYSFPALDLGRAVLSGTLGGSGFRRDAVAAFAEGYRSVHPLPPGTLLRAVKYVWCIESLWWIKPPLDSSSRVPARFAEEMIHTAEHWDQLDTLLGDI
ncbi:phosphotransferase [Paenibacillus sp. LMG 31459]|uniref:Phosphotransferase n=1 Tax=Paenibacillus phytohabitans TaxID=2654978 RepID=A0ABX1YFZ3_9BACL|nr:phosphotransferase [Paenibacillus phytohabitans]NOU79922.1 phosphotransferase [Paenibacillus phytohabitans]